MLVTLPHRKRRVPEDLHDHALGHAGGEQDRRGGLTQVVEAQALLLARAVADPGLPADLAEAAAVQVRA